MVFGAVNLWTSDHHLFTFCSSARPQTAGCNVSELVSDKQLEYIDWFAEEQKADDTMITDFLI